MWLTLLQQLAATGGPVGVTLALAYMYIRQLHRELREVETKRVQDAQTVIQKMLDLNDKWHETINSQVEVSEAQKSLLADLRTMMMNRR